MTSEVAAATPSTVAGERGRRWLVQLSTRRRRCARSSNSGKTK